jgi:phosphoribosylaminoimidazolecarboxamide formyltransferase/IMP cyclohydrolase
MQALISVSDKAGVVELARELAALGVKLLSTGGTARLLADAGLTVTEVAAHTGFPEMLDGRVKTLHPTIHGGLLARRDSAEHMAAIDRQGISTIDLLVVNLYPFEATVAKQGCTLADAIENIDIGGPAMVRSAAKNWNDVAVLTDPAQYAGVVAELKRDGKVGEQTRFALAVAAFDRIAQYDGAISDYLSSLAGPSDGVPERREFPAQANGRFVKLQDLRYGENPHQRAAFYRDLAPAPGSLVTAKQLQGKELSYNNIADADAAWECVKSFAAPACVIVKHANPCGVAVAEKRGAAYAKALKTDPTSAFGGIIAFNGEVDRACAEHVAKAVRRGADRAVVQREALAVFAAKANTRVLQIALPGPARGATAHDLKRGRLGTPDPDRRQPRPRRGRPKGRHEEAPTPAQLNATCLFAWTVARFVKSNAIVFCAGGMTLGVGAGQMSRIDSARIASIKAEAADSRSPARRSRATRSSRSATASTSSSTPAPRA